MGAIQDRTREHLGTSDKVIMANRRALLKAIEQVQAGARPPMALDAGDGGRADRPRHDGLHRAGRPLGGVLARRRSGQARRRAMAGRRRAVASARAHVGEARP